MHAVTYEKIFYYLDLNGAVRVATRDVKLAEQRKQAH